MVLATYFNMFVAVAMQIPLSELKLPLSLKWRKASDMPFGMCDYPQAVAINRKVYIGGRLTSSSSEGQTVMVYDPQNDTWTTLPQYDCVYFAMAVVNNQVVLIGGVDVRLRSRTAQLGVWNEQSQTWTNPFLPMPTARCSPSAITYDRWLVVIGGRLEDVGSKLSDVEILDTTSGQWYCGAPLPQPRSSVSAATIGNICFALGGFTTDHLGSKKVFNVCLDNLISQAVSPPNTQPTPSPWLTLPDTPLKYSTTLTTNGALLAVGGYEHEKEWVSRAIHLYQPSSRSWVKAGELLLGRATCACITLSSGEIR